MCPLAAQATGSFPSVHHVDMRPVANPASSEARNANNAAISSGLACLPRGILLIDCIEHRITVLGTLHRRQNVSGRDGVDSDGWGELQSHRLG